MLLALRMCKIGAIVLMNSKAQTTFEGADVVLEEIWIFVQIDSLERELPQSLTSICVGAGIRSDAAAAEFRTRSIL